MFCADYVAAFAVHAFVGLVGPRVLESDRLRVTTDPGKAPWTETLSAGLTEWFRAAAGLNPGPHGLWVPFVAGAAAGGVAACAVAPFDFIREGSLPNATALTRFRSNLSVVPYSAAFFGVYFSQRDPSSRASRVCWAFGGAASAALAEIPFDAAKRALFGSRAALAVANLIFVPAGALMLVMYDDHVLDRYNRPQPPT